MNIRKATVDDIDLLIKLRIDFLIEDRGSLTREEEAAVAKQLKKYFARHIPANTLIGILAEVENRVVSVAYLAVSEKPASPSFITGITGTMLNVFTYPEHRRKGIATKVLNRIIEEAKALDVSCIELSATSDGKPLYEKLGFELLDADYTSMKLNLI